MKLTDFTKSQSDIQNEIDTLIVKSKRALIEQEFPYSMYFRIPDSKNIAWIQIKKGYSAQGMFRLLVSVSREGAAMMHSNYFYSDMTEEDMRKYLAGNEDTEKIRRSILKLSESVDDKEGEFPSDY